MELEKTIRRRMNITTSVEGVKTWDTTVDGTGYSIEELALELDSQVKMLEAMTRPPVKDIPLQSPQS